ncbi:MAG: DUF21 domain-containing protein [Deltaproteobacteria bacterium]|nr:DUF21 domain-containing protein [Deltaproteobacteria bacterium]
MFETGLVFMIGFLLILLVLSAFFSGSETALMAISRLRMKFLSETKPRRVAMVEKILSRPERLIGTILLGNNLVNVAMSAISTALAISFWGEKGIVYVTGILTVVILLFAEITPKVYAKYFNERVSMITAPILNGIMWVLTPFVVAITYVSNRLLLLVGIDVSKIEKPLMTEAEIHTCIRMGWDEGAISSHERDILPRVFTLNDKSVGDVMIPKSEMKTMHMGASIQEAIGIVSETGFSRFPVWGTDPDQIIGFIHAKDLFGVLANRHHASLEEILRPPEFTPADRKIDQQLRTFKQRKVHLAVVLEQGGNVVGLVTLEDILEELVGSIEDEHDD